MAVAFDAIGPGTAGTSSTVRTISWAHTAGTGGNSVLAYIVADLIGTFGTCTATYGGTAMTLLSSQESGGSGLGGGGIFCFGTTTGTAGAHTVSATYTGTASSFSALFGVSASFTGGDSFGTPADSHSSGQTSAGSNTLPTSTSGGMSVLAVCDESGGEALTAPAGIAQRWKLEGGTDSASSNTIGGTIVSTGSAIDFAWTQTDDYYGAIAVEVQPAASGISGPFNPVLPAPKTSLAGQVTGIAFVAGAEVTNDNGFEPVASKPITIPAAVTAGDVILVVAGAVPGTGTTVPTLTATSTGTALTALSPASGEDNDTAFAARAWWAVAGASDAGKIITVTPSASSFMSVSLAVYSGCDTTSPVDVAQGAFGGASTATVTCPVLETGYGGDWAVYLNSGASEAGDTPTAPSGSTSRPATIAFDSSVLMTSQIADSNGPVGAAGTSIGGGHFACTADTDTVLSAYTIGLKAAVPVTGAFAIELPALQVSLTGNVTAWSRLQSAVSPIGYGAATATFGSDLTSGTTLIAASVTQDSGITTTGVADADGNAFIKISAQTMGGTRGELSLWALNTPPGDAGTTAAITATGSDGTNMIVLVQEVSGLATGVTAAELADGTAGTSSGVLGESGSTTNPTYSSTASGEYLLSALGCGGNVYADAPPGMTADPNNVLNADNGVIGFAYESSDDAAESAVWTNPLNYTSDQYAEILVAFRLAGGTNTESGPFNPVLPKPAVSLTGTVTASGSLSIHLPAPHTSLTATVRASGSLAIVLPSLRTSLAATVGVSGAFAIALPAPKMGLSGQVTASSSLSISLPALRTSLAATITKSGPLDIVLPAPRTSLEGGPGVVGPLAIPLPAPETSLTGTVVTVPTESGPFNIWLPGGDAKIVFGEFAVEIPAPEVAITGFTGTISTLSIDLPVLRTSISGTVYFSNLDIVLPPLATALAGDVYYSNLDIVLPAPQVSLTGKRGSTGPFFIIFGRTSPFMLRGLIRKLGGTPAPAPSWISSTPRVNWKAGVTTTDWEVSVADISISQLSTEYVLVPVSASQGGSSYNPTSDGVSFAFAQTPTYVVQNGDWVTGSWETASTSLLYPYNAKCLVGPGGATTLTTGLYYMYVKITDDPEIPVLAAGTLTIT